MLTAYTPRWRVCWTAGVDALLVGDSVGMVVLGYENTLAVTLDDMLHHTRAGPRRVALVVTDMPFLSYQVSAEEAVRNAGRLLQEGARRPSSSKVDAGVRGGAPDGRRRWHSGDGTSRAAAAIRPSARRLHQASHPRGRR